MNLLMQVNGVVLVAALVLPLICLVIVYNGHVSRRNAVDYAFSSINVQLKKRWDLIPRLVETVKGYAKHERKLVIQVTEARKSAQAAKGDDRFRRESEVSQELPRIMALAESS